MIFDKIPNNALLLGGASIITPIGCWIAAKTTWDLAWVYCAVVVWGVFGICHGIREELRKLDKE